MAKSRSLNKVMLIGNLTRDPLLKETSNGSKVCTFGIATNSRWNDSNGMEQERTEFHNIVAWNGLAEVCMKVLAVGMLVYVEGELRTHVFGEDENNKSYKTEIKIEEMKLLDPKGKKGVAADGDVDSMVANRDDEDGFNVETSSTEDNTADIF